MPDEPPRPVTPALVGRGPAWWDDGAPDDHRRMAVNTPDRAWFEGLSGNPRT